MGQLVEGDNYRKMAKNWPKWPKVQNQHFGGKSKGRQSPQSPLRTAKNYMEIPYKFFLNTPENSSFFLSATSGISTLHTSSKPLGIPCPQPPLCLGIPCPLNARLQKRLWWYRYMYPKNSGIPKSTKLIINQCLVTINLKHKNFTQV